MWNFFVNDVVETFFWKRECEILSVNYAVLGLHVEENVKHFFVKDAVMGLYRAENMKFFWK